MPVSCSGWSFESPWLIHHDHMDVTTWYFGQPIYAISAPGWFCCGDGDGCIYIGQKRPFHWFTDSQMPFVWIYLISTDCVRLDSGISMFWHMFLLNTLWSLTDLQWQLALKHETVATMPTLHATKQTKDVTGYLNIILLFKNMDKLTKNVWMWPFLPILQTKNKFLSLKWSKIVSLSRSNRDWVSLNTCWCTLWVWVTKPSCQTNLPLMVSCAGGGPMCCWCPYSWMTWTTTSLDLQE